MDSDTKKCVVPQCQNTSTSTPQKLFIPAPIDNKRRNLWLRISKRNPKELAASSDIYFCEDHFDLKTDMANYLQYELGFSKTMEMVPGCLPTKFKCQMTDKMAANLRNIQASITKKSLDLTHEQKKQKEATTSATQSEAKKHDVDIQSNDTQAQKTDSGFSEKMAQSQKVFSSNIMRNDYTPSNNLYDLLKVVPASPVEVNNPQNTPCDFTPKTDKYYIPKKKSRLRVRTVRSIRKEMEEDIYSYLPKALEKQKATLLKKIMDGSTRNEATQVMADKILTSDQPITRSSWQMLMNINPRNNQHSKQFVLWNGTCVQVNGSRGGKNKFICNYDIGHRRLQDFSLRKRLVSKKKGLLQNSLCVKFKPGPLRRKKYLDDSHQKYHIGLTELVTLPKPGLEVQPLYGMTLEAGVAKFVNSLREDNGIISEKWAEFAVTMLGSIKKSNAVQQNADSMITFDLSYKCYQNRILMRKNIQGEQCKQNIPNENYLRDGHISKDSNILLEVQHMMEDMMNCVEINLDQENMYSGEDQPRDTIPDGPININYTKDKAKKRYCELDRLDVTVIQLPEENRKNNAEVCNKPFCKLGCICPSLECSYSLRTHCGLLGCMFQCTCDFSRYMDTNILKSGCSEFIPGLLNLDSEINLLLAKEEQKFRQTVLVSGKKSILLKRRKRNCKASKKYEDFYTNLNLKSNEKTELAVSIVDLNFNCQNIEPWCMIHNLYRCFCKGRFIETSVLEPKEDIVQNTVPIEDILPDTKSPSKNDNDIIINFNNESIRINMNTNKYALRPYSSNQANESCARVNLYEGRKYNDEYYKSTNAKIRKMEQNDVRLRERIINILNNSDSESNTSQKQTIIDSASVIDVECNTCDESTLVGKPVSLSEKPQLDNVNKSKLVAWLESSYKLYKQRMMKGITKTSLEPPVLGKLGLYTWEFILKRYKQRKNFFMVSKKAPFRIFIAVDGKGVFFENCININDIELADLHKFPVTVKNLLTSACDSQDDFCILCGWNDCWEIIGSVSKLSDKCKTSIPKEDIFTSNDGSEKPLTEIDLLSYNSKSLLISQSTLNLKRQSSSESSKWFVMNVENDFTEIQFCTRGFFVTYSSIIKAINVARGTGKTVRLSSQKCADKTSGPQFGIYAIPDAKEYRVFVGPYEMDEHLGIETVINSLHVRKDKNTRGVWITTDKVDNGKVIDNPLSYMPFSHIGRKSTDDLEINTDSVSFKSMEYLNSPSNQINFHQIDTSSEDSDVTKTPTKYMKPIKIRKTQDFYHIASNGALKKIFFKKNQIQPNIPPSFLPSRDKQTRKISRTCSVNSGSNKEAGQIAPIIDLDQDFGELAKTKKTIGETAPEIKITAVYSKKKNKMAPKRSETGMFILKPEEINQKLLENRLEKTVSSNNLESEVFEEDSINMDIENFLANSVICKSQENEVLEISDDTDDDNLDDAMQEAKPVEAWIQCTNIDNFGWIKGRKNCKNLLSFEFPGFIKPTEFYEVREAYSKINQVLSRKIYIPKCNTPEWEVVTDVSQLKNMDMLDVNELGPEYVLTKQGIRHKQDLLQDNKSDIKTKIKPRPTDITMTEVDEPSCSTSTSKVTVLTRLEEQSTTLDNENDYLWNETLTNKANILRSLSEASEENRQEMTEKLKNIMSMTE